jgi:multidrug efflux pump
MVLAMNIDLVTREIRWTQLATSIAGGLAFATRLTLTPCLLIYLPVYSVLDQQTSL